MLTLGQMRKNQTLPVTIQIVFGQSRCHADAASGLPRFEQNMRFGIMPERLKMADALDWLGDGFTLQNRARTERHIKTETIMQGLLNDFQLHCAHQLHMDLG